MGRVLALPSKTFTTMTIKQLDSFRPYVEISEDEYFSLLCGVPPYLQRGDWFICGEAYDIIADACNGDVIDIYAVCFSWNGHYFKAFRPVRNAARIYSCKYDGVPLIEREINKIRSYMNDDIFSDVLVLHKRGCDFASSEEYLRSSDLLNHRLYFSFINKDGVFVHGDVSTSWVMHIGYHKSTTPKLCFDLAYISFHGSFSYKMLEALYKDAPLSNSQSLLAAVNSVSKYQYKSIKII